MVSLVQFAREFEKLKSDLLVLPTDGLKLLRMIEFWSSHESELLSPSYHTFLDDFLVISELVSEESLYALSIDELVALKNALKAVADSTTSTNARSLAGQKLKMVLFNLIKTLCYIGDLDRAIPLATELSGSRETPRFENAISAQSDSYEALTSLTSFLERDNPGVYEVLTEVRDRWEAERECIGDDRALCVLVENDPTSGRSRGILGTLNGTIERRGQKAKDENVIDTVTFGNQLRAQDDPLASVLYNSLEAVRSLPGRFGLKDNAKDGLHAYFSIPGSSGVFTGGSIGFAAGVLTYSQLLKPMILRERRFIPASVAFTGTLDPADAIGSVNGSTLRDKINRAFFSHLEMLAIPEANLPEAKAHLQTLSETYPRRRLRLIGFERLSDALSSHDIMRSEKVCLGEFAAKKAIRYSRSTRLQIPVLIGLLYFLLCLVYPKAWIFFDRNPCNVELTQTGFSVLNQKHIELWSKSLSCYPLDADFPPMVHDLNGDDRNEVLLLPASPSNSECQIPAYLHAFDWRGDSLFTVPCANLGATPPDTSLDQHYSVQPLELAVSNSGIVIVTQVYGPGRTHFKFWNSSGEMLGWYVNAGHYGGVGKNFAYDTDGKLYFLSFNNLADRASLLILKPDSCEGVSPPYTGSSSRTRPGTQLQYILFPRSDVNLALNSVYSHADGICILHEGLLQAEIKEGDNLKPVLQYYIDNNCRVIGVNPTDAFTKVRRKLVKDQLLEPMTSTYYDDLRDSVLYWQNSAWVSEGELRFLDTSIQ